jgi:predicted nuclease of predicted toxin-antitoxin system
VRFIVDAQLPPALARHLQLLGHEAEHVIDLGLERASDRDIWEVAAAQSAIIVTKDEDFPPMRAIQEEGPTILWIRIGNTTRPTLWKLGRRPGRISLRHSNTVSRSLR